MRDDRVYLLHIQDAAHRIRDYTREGRETFLSDTKTQDAVLRNIEIIGKRPRVSVTISKQAVQTFRGSRLPECAIRSLTGISASSWTWYGK
jgi:uncharacterized protein with HEPN domain